MTDKDWAQCSGEPDADARWECHSGIDPCDKHTTLLADAALGRWVWRLSDSIDWQVGTAPEGFMAWQSQSGHRGTGPTFEAAIADALGEPMGKESR